MTGLKQVLVNILYPPVCPLCFKVVNGTKGHSRPCRVCSEKLEYISGARCMKCGKSLKNEDDELCFDCKKHRHLYDQGIAVFEYTDGIKQSIYHYKYKGCREFAEWYGEEAYRVCSEQFNMWRPQVIIPVPLYEKKKKIRGYNQAELIAERIGMLCGLPVDAEILKRSRHTVPMKKLNDIQRAENVKKAFTIASNIIEYKRVVLVDDIYTTGATMDACAGVLKASGVEKVYCVSLCVGRGI